MINYRCLKEKNLRPLKQKSKPVNLHALLFLCCLICLHIINTKCDNGSTIDVVAAIFGNMVACIAKTKSKT